MDMDDLLKSVTDSGCEIRTEGMDLSLGMDLTRKSSQQEKANIPATSSEKKNDKITETLSDNITSDSMQDIPQNLSPWMSGSMTPMDVEVERNILKDDDNPLPTMQHATDESDQQHISVAKGKDTSQEGVSEGRDNAGKIQIPVVAEPTEKGVAPSKGKTPTPPPSKAVGGDSSKKITDSVTEDDSTKPCLTEDTAISEDEIRFIDTMQKEVKRESLPPDAGTTTLGGDLTVVIPESGDTTPALDILPVFPPLDEENDSEKGTPSSLTTVNVDRAEPCASSPELSAKSTIESSAMEGAGVTNIIQPNIASVSSSSVISKVEKMDIIESKMLPSKIPTSAPETQIPLVAAKVQSVGPIAVKFQGKHPPPATKTIKRDQRKSSNTSPPFRGSKSKFGSSPGGRKDKKKRPPPKEDGQDGRNDFYCWVCHKEGEVLCCELCPRVFHAKCLNMVTEPEGDWFCPECERITEAECKETQSRAMSMLTIDQFSLLLKYVIQRMKVPGTEPFHDPVDTKMFPDYLDYVFHPMDLSTIEKSVKRRKYGCPEAFIIDFKWIIHNCVIYNSMQSKLTQVAKSMLKIAEREISEIEVCPECYLNSCRKRENWFCEPCKDLHPLVWAKLQGFPHWPAKALRIEKGLVDVRFFGQHDRAWIPLSGCYLISKELPLPVKNKKGKSKGPTFRGGMDGAMQEMQIYIDNIRKITGEFEYAPPRTLLTHCDLYRKTGTVSTGRITTKSDEAFKVKEEIQKEGRDQITLGARDDSTESKAKIEEREHGSGKEFVKSSVTATSTAKKGKLVTTSGEHPNRSFAGKKKKASMEFLSKTIESCKASLGIEKLQDVKMNSGSDETTSSSDDDEEEENEDAKEKTPVPVPDPKPQVEEDDSDAELVIDLGDMDESVDTTKQSKDLGTKPEEIASKKRRVDDVVIKQVPGKPPLKSILMNPSKSSSDKDERKKMLAKALSEKIATGKRKHDIEPGSLPITKMRKVQEDHSRSPVDLLPKPVVKVGQKEKKKPHHGSKHADFAGKPAKKIASGVSKHKDARDGSQKPPVRKQPLLEKPTKVDKIPTEADAKKLFNGGRIPRKNPVSNISDEEASEKDQENVVTMETTQIPDIPMRRRSSDRVFPPPQIPPNTNKGGGGGLGRQLSMETRGKGSANDAITFESLKKYSDKVMDSVQKVFYEMYTDLMVPLRAANTETEANAATMHQVAQLRLELERLKWMHEQEIAELKHNHDLTVAEIRQSLENEKKQLLLDARMQAEGEKTRAVDEAKRKQWCAFCNREAIFYCCWNTSYCDYPCQQKHWPKHMNSCTQARESGGQNAGAGSETKPSNPVKATASAPLVRGTSATATSPSKDTTTTPSKTTGKSTIILPSSLIVKTASSATSAGILPSSDQISKNSTPAVPEPALHPQRGSGLAISAIGARLLAAKQEASSLKDSSVPLSKEAPPAKPGLPTSTPSRTATTADHVKTTLESPLSPDAKSTTIAFTTSSLTLPSKPVVSDGTHSKPDKADLTQCKVKVTLPSSTFPKAEAKIPAVVTVAKSGEGTKTKVPADTKKVPARQFPSTQMTYSSPSVVASLITGMDTPLSSSLSSSPGEHSSSLVETPDKKPSDVKSKFLHQQEVSAFTKFVPTASKAPISDPAPSGQLEKSQKALTFVAKSTDAVPDGTKLEAPSFKPIEKEVPTMADESPMDTEEKSLPQVAPVLEDSYLSRLQETLGFSGGEKGGGETEEHVGKKEGADSGAPNKQVLTEGKDGTSVT